MRYLTLSEFLELHRRIIGQSGGGDGVRDLGSIESAVAQPQLTSREEFLKWVTSRINRLPTYVWTSPPDPRTSR